MSHPIHALAVQALGSRTAFDIEGRKAIMLAYVATFSSDDFDAATRALVALSAALKKAKREKAACALAVLVMSGAPVLRRRAAAAAALRANAAEKAARTLCGVDVALPNAPTDGSMKAFHSRFRSPPAPRAHQEKT